MQGYLLDTSVVSVLAPGREAFVPTPLGEWLQAHHQSLFLPAIAIAEMAQGIGKLRRAGGAERADRLDRWLDGLLATYADRIVPLDAQAARLAGHISDAALAQGGLPPRFCRRSHCGGGPARGPAAAHLQPQTPPAAGRGLRQPAGPASRMKLQWMPNTALAIGWRKALRAALADNPFVQGEGLSPKARGANCWGIRSYCIRSYCWRCKFPLNPVPCDVLM